jgi:hypothetical protein
VFSLHHPFYEVQSCSNALQEVLGFFSLDKDTLGTWGTVYWDHGCAFPSVLSHLWVPLACNKASLHNIEINQKDPAYLGVEGSL